MRDGELQVAAIRIATDAEGPGRRAALWVQGCSIRCPGCFNPHTWAVDGGSLWPVERVVAELLVDPRTEGITLLGGEPFDQPQALAAVAAAVQAAGKGVIAFSGYTIENLRRRADPGVHALLDGVDLLIDGPYLQDRLDVRRPLVGSQNQRFHCLTPRYQEWVEGLPAHPDRLEVTLNADGSVGMSGWATPTALEDVLEVLELRDVTATSRGSGP